MHGALASRPGITRFLSKKRLILKKGTSTSYCLSYLSIISQINVTDFPITSRDVTKKTLPARGIIKLFPARESLVSDIPTGDGKTVNLFLQWRHLDILHLIVICGGVQASMQFTSCATTRTYRAVPSWPRYSLRRVQTSNLKLSNNWWHQCSGSVGSSVADLGSLSWIPDPNFYPDSFINKQNKMRCFATSQWYGILKTDGSVPTVRNKQKNLFKKIFFCSHVESRCQKEQDPDPCKNVTDPEH